MENARDEAMAAVKQIKERHDNSLSEKDKQIEVRLFIFADLYSI